MGPFTVILVTSVICSHTRQGTPGWYRLTFIPAWIGNHMLCEVWDEITNPFLNFNVATVYVWERMSYFMPGFTMDMFMYPWWDWYWCMWNNGPLLAPQKCLFTPLKAAAVTRIRLTRKHHIIALNPIWLPFHLNVLYRKCKLVVPILSCLHKIMKVIK